MPYRCAPDIVSLLRTASDGRPGSYPCLKGCIALLHAEASTIAMLRGAVPLKPRPIPVFAGHPAWLDRSLAPAGCSPPPDLQAPEASAQALCANRND